MGTVLHPVFGGNASKEDSLHTMETHQLLKVGAEEDVGCVLALYLPKEKDKTSFHVGC